MEASAQESYLVTEVMTATPQKLQLMLIDAAIRSAEKARRLWQEQKNDEACEALIHAQEIVGQMLASLNHEPAPELTRKVAAVYLFIFRSLMEANFHRDESRRKQAGRGAQGVASRTGNLAPGVREAGLHPAGGF